MAILGTDQEQQDPNAPPAPTGGNIGGGGGYVGGGGGQGATTTAAPSSSGSYTNLSSYLNANQGSGDQMGGAVKDTLDNSGQLADKAIGTYKDSGSAAVKAGTQNVDPDQMAKIQAGTATFDPNVLSKINSSYNPATGTFTDPGKVEAKYTGPGSVAAPAYAGPQDAATMGGQAGVDRQSYGRLQDTLSGNLRNANGGQEGVAALEKGIYQQPSYTQGENNLDAFLTGGSSAFQHGLQDVNAKWGGEAAKGSAADADLNSQIAAGKKTSTDTQTTYSDAIKKASDQSKATAGVYQAAAAAQTAARDAWRPPAPAPAPVVAPAVAAPVAPAPTVYDPKLETPEGQMRPRNVARAGEPIGMGTVDDQNYSYKALKHAVTLPVDTAPKVANAAKSVGKSFRGRFS